MRFRVGINYWPSRTAMRWWRSFDEGEVERDFARIREAGFDSVRIFLRWEDFQPAPDRVDRQLLDLLVKVADIAMRNELSVVPTLFTGHMSGANWIPEWALDQSDETARFRVVSGEKVVRARPKNWYSDERILEAQARLAREVALALRGHAAVWAYDLGNENSNCVVPPSREAGVNWLKRMAAEIRSVDTKPQITIGLHTEDLEEDRLIGPREAAKVCDFLCMHGYPVYCGWAWGPTDSMALPYLGLITRWMGGRDVLFEEFGTPTIPLAGDTAMTAAGQSAVQLLNEYEAAAFIRRALEQLHRFGIAGGLLWCYGDYSDMLWTEPPLDEAVHERFFGLWRADGSAKPAVAEVEKFGSRQRREPADDFDWIDVTIDEFYLNPRENLSRLYGMFRERFKEEG
ncbi:MAG TPA: beta-galactosidase [Blastocatellia bacterium]|nr:beta-galactosidase [Blastocatellia bacterium]